MIDAHSLIKKVKQIEIKARRNSDQLLSGEYHSSFKGRGMTFSEVRKYQYGDDVRAIDWNVTARLNETYVKVFEEERELTLMLLVDVSGSTHFGTEGVFKRELAAEICATLAFSALANNDKVGLLLFSDKVESYIPPRKGRSHLLRIIKELLEYQPKSKGTRISPALEYLLKVQKKKAIVFLLSDFFTNDYQQILKLAARKHDLIGLRLFDHTEAHMPNLGMIQMYHSETNTYQWVNTSSAEVRKRFAKNYQSFANDFQQLMKKNGAGQIEVDIQKPYMRSLINYFSRRK